MTRNRWLLVLSIVVVAGGAFNWYRYLANTKAPPAPVASEAPHAAVPVPAPGGAAPGGAEETEAALAPASETSVE